MLGIAPESPASGAPRKSGGSFFTPETVPRYAKYTPKRQDDKPYKAVDGAKAPPRCTVVTGPIDLYTGGEGGTDPDEEANPHT